MRDTKRDFFMHKKISMQKITNKIFYAFYDNTLKSAFRTLKIFPMAFD